MHSKSMKFTLNYSSKSSLFGFYTFSWHNEGEGDPWTSQMVSKRIPSFALGLRLGPFTKLLPKQRTNSWLHTSPPNNHHKDEKYINIHLTTSMNSFRKILKIFQLRKKRQPLSAKR